MDKEEISKDLLIIYQALLNCELYGDYDYKSVEDVLKKYGLDKKLELTKHQLELLNN